MITPKCQHGLVEEIGECARTMQPQNDDAGDLDLIQSAVIIVQWLELRRRLTQNTASTED